jgi:ribose transport system ATP-binding protein
VTADPSGGAVLSVTGMRKVYGGTVALAGGELEVAAGEIHGVVGENGAGKSTLIRSLAGTPPPDSGTISVDGRPFPERHTPADAAAAGLGFIHQDAALVDELSVGENIALVTGYAQRRGVIDWRQIRRSAAQALQTLGVDLDPQQLVAELPPASRMIVAIARALVNSPRVLILDEPTASLSARDTERLFTVLRGLRDSNRGIVFVSHRLDEVTDLCDRITVLRDGHTVGTVGSREVSQRELVKMICGQDVDTRRSAQQPDVSDPVLRVSGLSGPFLEPISFEVAGGEIVGLTGMRDAGHHVLGELLFGVIPRSGGEVELLGRPFRPRRPADAIERGVAYIPPDRDAQGVAKEMSLLENLFMNPASDAPPLRRLLGGIRHGPESREARTLLQRFRVTPPVPDERISALSGGNVQKVLVARWLRTTPALLIVSDLTVGVDVGARADIHREVRRMAQEGSAVIVLTSDFEEIEAICTRTFVLQRGHLIDTLYGDEVTVRSITARALVGAHGGEG